MTKKNGFFTVAVTIVLMGLLFMGAHYNTFSKGVRVLFRDSTGADSTYIYHTGTNLKIVGDAGTSYLELSGIGLKVNSVSIDGFVAGIDTFAATKTIDTVLISGITATSPLTATIRNDGSNFATAPLSIRTTAGTLFVYRAAADTAAFSVYTYNGWE